MGLRSTSSWWKGVPLLETEAVPNNNWFSDGIIWVTRDVDQTLFWDHVLVGHVSLRDTFPRLFQISTQ